MSSDQLTALAEELVREDEGSKTDVLVVSNTFAGDGQAHRHLQQDE